MKSVVMRGRLLEKIISSKLERKLESMTILNFSSTTVNSATNSCSLVSGIQFLKSSSKVPNGNTMVFSI